jgi:hypothetical protein
MGNEERFLLLLMKVRDDNYMNLINSLNLDLVFYYNIICYT